MITFNKNDNTVTGDAAEIAEFVFQYESKVEQAKQAVVADAEEKVATVENEENKSANQAGI